MFFLKIETQKYELGHMFFPHPYYKSTGVICQLGWKSNLSGIYTGFIGNFFSVSKFMKMFHKVAGSQEVLGVQGILMGKHKKGVEQFLK